MQETLTSEQFQELLKSGGKSTNPPRKFSRSERESLEKAFLDAWKAIAKDLPLPETQAMFHPTRKWRFDFAWKLKVYARDESGAMRCEEFKVAVEIQGGAFSQGGHSRGAQQARDHAKLNEAQRLGWIVLQYGTKAMGDPYKVAAEVAELLRTKIPNA